MENYLKKCHVFQGEVRFNGKILRCRTGNNEHMSIKLKKKKEEITMEWWMTDWLEKREEWKISTQKLH